MDPRERFDDPQQLLLNAMSSWAEGMWTAIPGIIKDVSKLASAATVSVQPAIQGVVTDREQRKTYATLPLLVDVPVVFPRGGGYTLTFPVRVGDECLCIFSSRCIDNWWAQGGVQPPFEFRTHDLSDAFALVGPFSQRTKISGISTSGAQLRNDAGTLSVSLDSAGGIVSVKAPTRIVLDAPDVHIPNGSVSVPNGNVVATGIGLKTHRHLEMGDGALVGPPVES